MKLAFCLFKYFPFGGLQRDFLQFYRCARRRGHQVRVYAFAWEGPQPEDIDLHLVPKAGLTSAGRNNHYSRYVASQLASNPVDLVVGFNKMPGLDVYYAADSCFEHKAQHERGWLYRQSRRYRHFHGAEANIFGRGANTQILLISETEKAKFVRHYDTEPERMVMLPPGISQDRRAPANAADIRRQLRLEWDIAEQDNLLLFVGSGFVKKGLDRAIAGLAALPPTTTAKTRLMVIGQDKKSSFTALAEKLQVASQVSFLGGRNDIPQFQLAADALVHPALDEAAGIILLEAVVAGLPVLVTDVCGYAHHIARGAAGIVLASPFDQNLYNKALCSMLDRDQQQRWQTSALAYADSEDLYSMHSVGIDQIEALYQRRQGAGP